MSVRHTVIVDRLKDWKWQIEGLELIPANDYLTRQATPQQRPMRIINLCRHYTYLSGGYYCSLLAEARNDTPMPTVADIVDLSRQSLYAFALPDLKRQLQQTIKRLAVPPKAPLSCSFSSATAMTPVFTAWPRSCLICFAIHCLS